MASQATRMAMSIDMTEAEFKPFLLNVLLITGILGIVVISCAFVALVVEVNSVRVSRIRFQQDLQSSLQSRLDSMLWKADTFLTIASTANKNMASGLTQVRVQVKESTDTNNKTAQSLSKAAVAVAQQTSDAVKATTEVAQAVVEKSVPIVQLQSDKPITVAPVPPPEIKFVQVLPTWQLDGFISSPDSRKVDKKKKFNWRKLLPK